MFIIRDDDLSAWTDANEIKELYGDFLEQGGKVSFAVIPNAFEVFHRENRSLMYQGTERKEIFCNEDIVDYLVPYVRKGQVEIMQHGYDHGYYIETPKTTFFLDKHNKECIQSNELIKFIPECCAKNKNTLERDLLAGREILEDTFGIKVKTFVPPSNGLTVESADIINWMGMNISGTITNKINRRIDRYTIAIILKKLLWKSIHSGVSYPKLMKYSNHMELTGHAFTLSTNMENFNEQLNFCVNHNYPFVLATHYWELLSNEELKLKFSALIDTQIKESNICLMTEVFNYWGRKY